MVVSLANRRQPIIDSQRTSAELRARHRAASGLPSEFRYAFLAAHACKTCMGPSSSVNMCRAAR